MPHLEQNGALRVPSNVKVIPVYDSANYGHDIPLHLTSVGFTEQAIVFSTSTLTRSLDEGGQPLDALPHVYSDEDDGLILHEGADSDFDVDYVFNSDMPAVCYKMSINICLGLNVSAYTSGNFNIGDLTATITEKGSNTRNIYTNTFLSGAANQTGTGTSLHWFTVDVVQPFQVFPNQPITINLKLTSTRGTGTSQAGIVSIAPFVKTAIMKSFAESCLVLHVHADVAHADDVWRFSMPRISNLGQ